MTNAMRLILCVVLQLLLAGAAASIWFLGIGNGVAEGLLQPELRDSAEASTIIYLVADLKGQLAGIGIGYFLSGLIASLLWLGYALRWRAASPQHVRGAAPAWWLGLLLALVIGVAWGFWRTPLASVTMRPELGLTLPFILLPLAALCYWPVGTLLFTPPLLKPVVPLASRVP